MNVLQNGACDANFDSELKKYTDLILSHCGSEPINVIVDENFECLIMYMEKLVAVAFDKASTAVFQQLFRAIVVFSLHLYCVSHPQFTRFVTECPNGFAEKFVTSVLTNFFPLLDASKRRKSESVVAEYAVMSVALFVYYSEDPQHNPYVKALSHLSEEVFPSAFDAIQRSMTLPSSLILFYTLMNFCPDFKSFCWSCADVGWVGSFTANLSREKPAVSMLRLVILLMLTEDAEFSNALSRFANVIVPEIIRFIHQFSPDHMKYYNNSVSYAISVLCNTGEYMDNIETKSCEMLFAVITNMIRNPTLHSSEDLYLIFAYIEAVVTHRPKTNISLVYTLIRNAHLLKKMNCDCCSDSFQITLHNLTTICDHLLTSLMGSGPLGDCQTVIANLSRCLESWDMGSQVVIREFPAFGYSPHDFAESARFFQQMIIGEMRDTL